MARDILQVKRNNSSMKSVEVLKKEEFEKLIETLGLNDKESDSGDDTDYFNAWGFGLREEDCDFTISASL